MAPLCLQIANLCLGDGLVSEIVLSANADSQHGGGPFFSPLPDSRWPIRDLLFPVSTTKSQPEPSPFDYGLPGWSSLLGRKKCESGCRAEVDGLK